MPDWTALAGFAGLAGALSDIQDRRVREGELQRRMTEGQGSWAPVTERPGGWDILDQFLGYSRPGQASFGGQRYSYTPFPTMTEQDVIDLGLSRPQTTTFPGQPSVNLAYAPPGSQPAGFGAPAAELAREPGRTFQPADLTAPPFVPQPGRTTTRDVALPGFVGRKMDPKFLDLLVQERLKEQFERFKLAEQQKLFDRIDTGGTSTDTGGAGFDVSGTGTGTGTPTPTPGPSVSPTGTAAPSPSAATTPVAALSKPPAPWTLSPLHRALVAEATAQNVDPQVALALVAQESNFDPAAVGKGGEIGLFQFTTGAAKDMGTTQEALRGNTALQIKTGIGFLKRKIEESKGELTPALLRYNGGGDPNYVANVTRFLPQSRQLVSQLAAQRPQPPNAQTQPQALSPAAGQNLPPGSVQVAGTGAGTPPTSTDPAASTQPPSGTVQVSPQEQFALTPEGRQRIESNNRRTQANNVRLQALDQERRRVQAGIRAGMPGMTDRLNALEASVRALRQENTNFYDDSQKVVGAEQTEWRARLQRREERRLRPGEVAAEESARERAKEEFRLGQSLQDVQKDDASLFRDPRTAEPVDPTLPYRQVLAGQKRKGEGGLPEVRKITKDQQERLEAVESALPRVQRIQEYIDQIYGPGGALARMTPADRAVFTGVLGGTPLSERLREQFAQKYPELAAASKYINANSEALARAIAGVKGAASEGDVQRARDMVANLTAAVTLWPPARFGISLPDTRAVALRTMNDLVQTIEGNTGQLLRNPNFRYPTLRRYELAEEPPPSAARPAPPALTPPTGLNPAWAQQRLPTMTPAQIRDAPPEVIRDIHNPSDIKGLSTEQRKALAARLLERNKAAVKLRRAS